MSQFTQKELLRYQRHLSLKQVSVAGQEKLKAARVLIIGMGGLGTPVVQYLAAAGVGCLGLMDFDRVEETNLQRQVIHQTAGIGGLKTESAQSFVNELNPYVKTRLFSQRTTAEDLPDIIKDFDLVVDATDNFSARYLINDACFFTGKPCVYGSLFQFEGQVSVFGIKNGPCYRCLFPEVPDPSLLPNCNEAGVLGVIPGIIGTLQAGEALKLILEIGDLLIGKLLLCNVLNMDFQTIHFSRNPSCALCGENPEKKELKEEIFLKVNQENIEDPNIISLSPTEFHQWRTTQKSHFLLDVREEYEFEMAHLNGKLIPLKDLERRLSELDMNFPHAFVVMCHKGGRSLQAAQYLRLHGFQKIYNLKGGLDAWRQQVDPNIQKY